MIREFHWTTTGKFPVKSSECMPFSCMPMTSNNIATVVHIVNIKMNWNQTYLIKSSKLCSFSVTTLAGLAAISHNSFGKHASRILLANVILSFKSICSNFALWLDFFDMKSSMSLVDGESADEKTIENHFMSRKYCCLCNTAMIITYMKSM